MSVLIGPGGQIPDLFQPVGDEDTLPATGDVLVSLERWTGARDELAHRSGAVAVQLPNTQQIEDLDPAVLTLPMLVLAFPGFGDGRAYSQARLLREARGFRGILRATGPAVVSDQIAGMRRCGIDQFQLRDDQSLPTALAQLEGFSLAYQPAVSGGRRVWQARRERSAV